jgi:serine protease AprX
MREFRYHACGFGIGGKFWSPLATQVSDGPSVALPSEGGHVHTRIDGMNVSGLLKTGPIFCHASSTNDPQTKTSIVLLSVTVEALNVCDVVTADRIVARLALDQADHEDQPHVVAIGSFFGNLRIAGEPVGVGLNMMLLTEHNTFDTLSRISSKLGVKSVLPGDSVVLSVVDKIQCGLPGITISGHAIQIPDFGDMRFAELLAAPTSRTLTMLRFSLHGSVKAELSIAEGRIGTSVLQSSSTLRPRWEVDSQSVETVPLQHKQHAPPPTPLAELLSDFATYPIASRQDLQSDVEAFAILRLSTPRDFLSTRLVSLSRNTGVPLHRLVLYRDACRSYLLHRSADARHLLSKKGLSDSAIFALTDQMTVRLLQMYDGNEPSGRIQVVVQLQNAFTLEELLEMPPEQRTTERQRRVFEMQAEVLRSLDVRGTEVFTVWLANQFIASFSSEEILRLAVHPAVRAISPTLPVRGCMDEALSLISAPRLRSTCDGSGQIVALIDSGVDDSHADFLPGHVLHKKDFTGKGSLDQHGHGTHLAGIIAGNSWTYTGVAPKATIWSYRALDENNSNSSHAELVRALQDAVEQAVKDNKKDNAGRMFVVNCSCEVPEGCFTSDNDLASLNSAFELATPNAVVVVAAGNGGPGSGTITAPGGANQVLTVGCTSSRPSAAPVSIPGFSSRGPGPGNRKKPDLVAPGGSENHRGDAYSRVSVVSCSLNQGTWNCLTTREKPWRVDTDHYGVSGTSQATAVVSGICALLLQEMEKQNRPVTHYQIAQALKLSAQNLNLSPDQQGKGLVDADAALSQL